jgi:hypothetical protein
MMSYFVLYLEVFNFAQRYRHYYICVVLLYNEAVCMQYCIYTATLRRNATRANQEA